MPESEETVSLVRTIKAPAQKVFAAWTDPAKLAKWWGPNGFTTTTHVFDFRPEGTWEFTMHGPDGVDYPNSTKYFVVEKHAKLVYDHGGNDDQPPMFRVTVVFSEVDGKTKMEMAMTLPTPEAAEQTRKFIKQAGGNATWDRLAEYLAKESAGKEQSCNADKHEQHACRRLCAAEKMLRKLLPRVGKQQKDCARGGHRTTLESAASRQVAVRNDVGREDGNQRHQNLRASAHNLAGLPR